MKSEKTHSKWKSDYFWMLLANAFYIIIFYLIMKIFV